MLHIEDGKHLLTEDKKIAFKFNKFFSSMILYADDAVLLCAASTAAELKEYLDTGFTQICTWYRENKLTLNVNKTKLMLTGSKNTLSAFQNFEFKSDGVAF